MGTPKYSIGSAVFVKMRGYPAWPAKVEGIADETPDKIKYHIFFYGTNQIAVCKEEEMCSYLEYREILGKPKKAKGFNKGILQMDTELGLVSDISDKTSNEVPGNYENNSSCVGIVETNDESDIAINEDQLIETTNETQEENKVSKPHKQLHDSYDNMLSTLKLEFSLDQILLGIQSSLSLKKANPEACLQHLNELAQINLNKLTLKKHPETVYTLMKVQTYVGNTTNWNMEVDEIIMFESQAEKIRNESKLICDQIKALFQAPKDVSFLDYFESELMTFKKLTKHMSLDDFYRLTKDPTDT